MRHFDATVGPDENGSRLDRILADMNPDVSRSEIQRDIRAGYVSVDGQVITQRSYRVREGEHLAWQTASKPPVNPRPLDLDILYEDDDLIVVDKPTGLVVHPGAGTTAVTLVEALLVDRDLPTSDDPTRPGIVHRLDKDTSGLILVAKTTDALVGLQTQFAARTASKRYLAVVSGLVAEEEGWIDAPVGRDPRLPSRMAVQPSGREAQTGFTVLKRMEDSTLLVVRPRTGRTHQIRVHARYINHPVVGDPIYGRDSADRLYLHAWRLQIEHPTTGDRTTFEAPIPPGFPDYPYEDLQ